MRPQRLGFVVTTLMVGLSFGSLIRAEPPSLTHLVPSGASRGKKIELVLRGKVDGDQRLAWASHPGLVVTPGEKPDRATVEVKADTPPGRYWIRFANAEGASPLRPFFVSGIDEVAESEPNNTRGKPQRLTGDRWVVNGVLAKTLDVDNYAVEVKQGRTIVAVMDANRTLGSPMDGLLQVVSPRGFVLAQNDDSNGLDPLVTWTARHDGVYLVRAFAFPSKTNSTIQLAGGPDYVYRLTITTAAFVDFSMPLAVSKDAPAEVELFGWNLDDSLRKWPVAGPRDQATIIAFDPRWANTLSLKRVDHAVPVETEPNGRDRPQAVKPPVTISGRIGQAGDRDVFSFAAKKGQSFRLTVESRQFGLPLDPVLRISDASGKQLKETDTRSADQVDEAFDWSAPADGEFRVEVRDLFDHGGDRYAYRLTIEPVRPAVTATVEKDRWVLEVDKTVEIKLTVSRSNGFDQPVKFETVEAPGGLDVVAVTSAPKGDTAKSVKLVIKPKAGTKPTAGGPLRIVGRVEGDPGRVIEVTAPIDGLTDRTRHLWLTVRPAAKKPKK